MSTKDDIIKKLREAFVPESLDVVDESHLHEGHAGHRPGGETHFRVYIVSPAFEGKGRIERHRMVNPALDAELKGSVHALAIKAQAPGEPAGREEGNPAPRGRGRREEAREARTSGAPSPPPRSGRGPGETPPAGSGDPAAGI